MSDPDLATSVLKRLSPAKHLANDEPQAPIDVAQLIFDATEVIESLQADNAAKDERITDLRKADTGAWMWSDHRGDEERAKIMRCLDALYATRTKGD